MMASTDWESKVAAKQQSALQKIPKEWLLPAFIIDTLQKPLAEHSNQVLHMDIPRKSGLFSDRELTITESYVVEELLKKLREGDLLSFEVTIAFSKRAAIAQQLVRSVIPQSDRS
jgi:amidase